MRAAGRRQRALLGPGANGRLGYCDEVTIGDDELPSAAGPVDLGAGGDGCPFVAPPPPPPPPPAVVVTPPPPAAPVDADAEALAAQSRRARGLRDCRAAARAQLRSTRSRLLKRYARQPRLRAVLIGQANRRAAASRRACMLRFARRPGRVSVFAARATAARKIVLTFRAVGSNGSKAPAAHGYLVKQSLRPIRSAREFDRAATLCKGTCSFRVTRLNAALTLSVTGLRPRTTYYYKVAARDNVSGLTGALSKTATAKTR